MKKNTRNAVIHVMSAKEATVIEKFNPYQAGHGVMQSVKYPNRSKRKAALRRELASY